MSILGTIAALFTGDKVKDTVIDLVRDKTGLNDLNERERVQAEENRIKALTEYQQATKHQSPMRRFIAFCFVSLAVVFVFSWLVTQSIGTIGDYQQYVYLAARIKTFYEDVLLMPTSIVLGFYFGVQAVNSLASSK